MKFSILINCHNQSKYINQCILSSLNQKYRNFEVIVIDSSSQKMKLSKFINQKKFKYWHIKKRYKYPEMNQMYKIMFGFKKTSGDYICLLDGDDKFSNKKLKKIFKLIHSDKINFNQDIPILINDNNQRKPFFLKSFKKNFIFQKFFISWPEVFGTSSITIKRKILEQFFIKAKPLKWKLLAIDIQLLIYCSNVIKISSKLENITFKRKHKNNLGDTYLNVFSKIFWKRRICQHDYSYFIKKKRYYNLDYIITLIINKFL